MGARRAAAELLAADLPLSREPSDSRTGASWAATNRMSRDERDEEAARQCHAVAAAAAQARGFAGPAVVWHLVHAGAGTAALFRRVRRNGGTAP